MVQRSVCDKLLDLSSDHALTITDLWYKALIANPRTASFKNMPKDILIPKVESFFSNLKRLYFMENPYREIKDFLECNGYMDFTLSRHIPLQENIYALIMMRRHLWLYADTQAMFNTSLDMWQEVESINRTLLLFDYAIIILAEKYSLSRI